MLIKIIESKRKDKTSKDIYSFECLRNTLSAHDEDGFFLYRVLTKKIATRNKEEEALIDKIVNFYTDEFIVKGEMYLENKMTILIAKIGQNDKVILDFLEIDSVKKRLHEAILKNHFEDLTDGLKKTCEKIRYNFISRGEINSHIKLTYTHLKKYIDTITKENKERPESLLGNVLLRDYTDIVALYQLDVQLKGQYNSTYK